MILMKFGGSTIGNSMRIRQGGNIIAYRLSQNPVVVVSALKGVTDSLESILHAPALRKSIVQKIIDFHRQLAQELEISCPMLNEYLQQFTNFVDDNLTDSEFSVSQKDHLLSFGERFSTSILACFLNTLDIPAKEIFSDQLGFITNDKFGEAEILPEGIIQIRANLLKVEGLPV